MAKGKSIARVRKSPFKDPERSRALLGNKNAAKNGISGRKTSIKTNKRENVTIKSPIKFSGSNFAKGFVSTAVGGPIGSNLSAYSVAKNNKRDVLAGKGKAIGKLASNQFGTALGSAVQGGALAAGAVKFGLVTANPAVAVPAVILASGAYGYGIGAASNKGLNKGLGKKNVRFVAR
jgi:hypothetical protein